MNDRIVTLEREIVRLRDRVDVLEGRPARRDDDRDVRLSNAIVLAVKGRAFSAGELYRHAYTLRGELNAALAASDIRSPKQLGKALQRLQGRAIGGVCLRRRGADASGAIWSYEPMGV